MDADAALQAYYARDLERDRLATGVGRLEFARTVEIVGRTLPAPPAAVADIGGGPGRYTDWLTGRGYRVHHRDVVASHVEDVVRRHGPDVDAAVGDARDVDLGDGSVDAVLLLGPLYHLTGSADRAQALAEAVRIVRPGGVVHAAAITRWATRLDGVLVNRAHVPYPAILDALGEAERTGVMEPIHDAAFTGFTHTPELLRAEVEASGLALDSLVAVESVAFALGDLDARMDDDGERALLLETLRAVESVPELLGAGPHLLATGRRPG